MVHTADHMFCTNHMGSARHKYCYEIEAFPGMLNIEMKLVQSKMHMSNDMVCK